MSISPDTILTLDENIVLLGKDMAAATEPNPSSEWWGLFNRHVKLRVEWKVWLASYQPETTPDNEFTPFRERYNALRADYLAMGGVTAAKKLGFGSGGEDHTGLAILAALAIAAYLIIKR